MSNLSLRLIVLTIALFFYQTSYAEIQANLLGHWALDETSGSVASDSSGNANNGIVRNATGSPWNDGKINGALSFNGSSDVSVPTTTGLQPSSLSLSAWVNLNSGNDWSWIAGEGDNFGMLVEQGSGGTWLYFYIHNGSTWVNAHANNLPISDQQWHHLVGTFDEAIGEIKIYVDGSQVASNIVSGTISYAKRSGFHIGSMDGERQFNGKIDDVRLYGQVLTQSEVGEVSDGGGTGGPNNQAPTVSAGSDSNTLVDIAIALNGSVTDDGLPIDSIITSQWTKVSGSGDVIFSETNNPSSTATFSAPGDYVLSLTATDGDLSSSDEINITVSEDNDEQNQAPSVSAGSDQSTLIGNSINLEGTASDDGLPAESIVSTLWSKVSGSGDVTFSDATNTSTTATFSTPGNYVLSLTATDGDLSSTDEINITVNEDVGNINQAPTVSAGADQSTLITETISLTGSASDDGLPAESILSTQWTKISGPGVVTFGNENSGVTNVVFSLAGTYVLSLSATDGELTSSDEITVIVAQDTGGIDITTGLLGHWPLDETAGTNATDVSGNGNKGSVRNNTDSSWQTGQLSGALTHDGNDDDVSIPTTATLQPSSLTVSSWIKPSDKNDWGWVAGEGDNFGLYVDQGFGGQWLYFYIYNGSTWVNTHVNNAPIFDGQWHHIAATFDETTGEIKVYADSVEVASSLVSGSISYNRGSGFHIGSMRGRRHFKGSIDDVRLYGRVLDQASIAAVSGDGSPPTNENSAPIIEDRELTVDEDSDETVITLTANDADGDDITFELVGSGPTDGVLTTNSADFSYKPNADFAGTDSFTYKANDGTTDSTTKTVTITVNGINDTPTADAGSDISTEVGFAVTLSGSGTDVDDDPLTYSWSENSTEIANTASFDYTPTSAGEHTLTLTVSDGTDSTTDDVIVFASITPPVFEISFIENITTTEVPRNLDSGLFIQGLQLIASVVDASGNPVEGAQPEFNIDSIDLSTPGDYPLVFTYPGATSKTLTVRVFNIAPQATGDNITVDEDSSNNPITLVGTDSNQGDTLTYSYQQPAHGTVSGTAPDVTYTPIADYAGTDSFSFTVSDGIDSSTATINITVTDVEEENQPPVATGQSVEFEEDSSDNLIVLSGDDPDGDNASLTYTIVSVSAGGTFVLNGQNLTYTPAANFHGIDEIVYTVSDGDKVSDPATILVTITDINDPPQNVSAGSDVTVAVNESITLNGVGVDHDGSSVAYSWSEEDGTVIATTASFDYTPTTIGTHNLTLTVTDDDDASVSDSLIVEAVGSIPDSILFTINNPFEIQAGVYTDIDDLYERALRDNVILLDQNGDEFNGGDYELFFEGYAENEDDFDTQTPGSYIIDFYYEDEFGEFFIEAELEVTITEANNAPILIMPLGDSITAGDGPGAIDDNDPINPLPSYRRDLWHGLTNAGYSIDFVGSEHGYTNTTISDDLKDFDPDHEGHAGKTAREINDPSSNLYINNLMTEHDGNNRPDVVLIHLGTNDILLNEEGSFRRPDQAYNPAVDDSFILNSIAGIIGQIKIKNPSVAILLAEIVPLEDEDVTFLNVKLKQHFSSVAGVTMVDHYSGFDVTADTWDGIHASASGELKMADKWYKALIRLPIMGNNANTDVDNDGVSDLADAFPLLPSETIDSDADGIGNNADTDDDNDGFSDVDELVAGTDPLDPTSFPEGVVQAPFLQAGFISSNTGNFDPNSDQSESRVIRTYAPFSGGETSVHDFSITNSGGEITNWALNVDSTRPVPMGEIVVTNDDFLLFDHGTIPGTEFDISIDSSTGIVTVIWPLSFIQGVDYRIDIDALEATITGSNSAGSFTRAINIVKPNGISALDHRHDSEGGFQCEPGRPHSSIGGELGFHYSRLNQLSADLDDLIRR